jgi:hypothetical protein
VRNIRTVTVRLQDLADELGFEVSDSLWPFVADRIAGGEVRLDVARQTLSYPEYVPVDQMVADVLEAMSDGRIEARACAVCAEVVDLNRDDGIFGDPENLERFVCSRCADTLSAREFYEKHLKTP